MQRCEHSTFSKHFVVIDGHDLLGRCFARADLLRNGIDELLNPFGRSPEFLPYVPVNL